MSVNNHTIREDDLHDLTLLVETAGDILRSLNDLAATLEVRLGRGADVDDVIELLRRKKAKVDTLNGVAVEIAARLRGNPGGRAGIEVPGSLRSRFHELMAGFRDLLDRESRIEDLIAGRGFAVTRRSR
jgi:hypothetical protein